MIFEEIDNNVSGVYVIVCTKNNKKYIGVSKNIKSRWNKHIKQLRNKQHHSMKLQTDYNKYGEDFFKFYVLERINYAEAKKLEQQYIETYKTDIDGYNTNDLVKNIHDRDEMICNLILEYIKKSYVPDGNMYCYDLFKMANHLNIIPTKLLRFIGIDYSRNFIVNKYLNKTTLIGLNWTTDAIFIYIVENNFNIKNCKMINIDELVL